MSLSSNQKHAADSSEGVGGQKGIKTEDRKRAGEGLEEGELGADEGRNAHSAASTGRSITPSPKRELQSRISDIDREIAAFQEQLVQMTAPTISAGSDDRTVPRSPPGALDEEADTADGSGDDLDDDTVDDNNGARTQRLVASIYAQNQQRAAQAHAEQARPFLQAFPRLIPGAYPEPSDWPFWQANEEIHRQLRPHLARVLARERAQEQAHVRGLQEEYRTLYGRWRRRVERLDRQREARQRAQAGTAGGNRRRPAPVLVDEYGFGLGPLFSAASVPPPPSSADVGDSSRFTSDAVHSDAELQRIIERLQYDDARNPDLRSQRTAAVIPPLAQGRERELLRFANDNHRITDPLTFYHARVPTDASRAVYANNGDTDRVWRASEAAAFVAAYLRHPKQFGRIAAALPHKSMNDCVLFYYRNKKPLRLKELAARGARRARKEGAPNGRRRKERARERRAREERERRAVAAAAAYVSAEAEGAALTQSQSQSLPQSALPHSAEIERRSKGSALLRSIIAANRQRKRDEAGATLLLGLGDDTEADAEAEAETEQDAPPEDDDEQPAEVVPAPEDPAPVGTPPTAEPPVSDALSDEGSADEKSADAASASESGAEEGELVGADARWEPRSATRHRQRTGRQRRASGTARRRESRSLSPAAASDEEVVEARGVVAPAAVSPPRRPRVVSRKSQSRFGATLTAVLEHAAPAPGGAVAATAGAVDDCKNGQLPKESALDRYVAAGPPAAERPISSHEALLIGAGAEPTRALDAMVDSAAGLQDAVLVGAATWLRDDRCRVLRAFLRHGADFSMVASLMPSKTAAQCRYFFHNYRTPTGATVSSALGAVAGEGSDVASAGSGAEDAPPADSGDDEGADEDDDDDDDDDDETPLAAQLAEALAAQSVVVASSSTPHTPTPALAVPSPISGGAELLPRPAPGALRSPSPAMTAKKSGYSSYWSVHERAAFMHYLVRLGQDWLALADAIGSKTGTQVRNYFRANREKLALDAVVVEYQRNRLQGTVPPMVPFAPPPAPLPGSPLPDDGRRERRGRKRKAADTLPLTPHTPVEAGVTHMGAVPLAPPMPRTAPATMASFPTMGVDGGRAVVYARPQMVVPGRPLQPQYVPASIMQMRPSVREPSADSLSSQPTPPPVEGLPRFSSSSPGASHALRISNLTNPPQQPPQPMEQPVQQQQPPQQVEQPVHQQHQQQQPETNVHRIGALLNSEPEPDVRTKATSWFGATDSQSARSSPSPVAALQPASAPPLEEDATGMAALALASMMGGGHMATTSTTTAQPPVHRCRNHHCLHIPIITSTQVNNINISISISINMQFSNLGLHQLDPWQYLDPIRCILLIIKTLCDNVNHQHLYRWYLCMGCRYLEYHQLVQLDMYLHIIKLYHLWFLRRLEDWFLYHLSNHTYSRISRKQYNRREQGMFLGL
ncbi:DNA-binding protein snt1 [Coemansia sp. Benny D115]|nr:DNA-binding protein snt1 [Coemansia sp. Benny D115]